MSDVNVENEKYKKIMKDLTNYLNEQCRTGLSKYEESLPDNLAVMQHIREKIIELESKHGIK